MNITIKFRGLGINNQLQARVKIMDSNNILLYDEYTFNAKVNLTLDSGHIYHLWAFSCGEIIDLFFYVEKKITCYLFYFPRCFVRRITFRLMDKNYPNLPIEKGVLVWQNK